MPYKELTNHKLPDILPMELAALLMNERHGDPTLDSLWGKNARSSGRTQHGAVFYLEKWKIYICMQKLHLQH